MHWITHTDPKQDGRYLVAIGYYTGTKTETMNFTKEGGWNTYRDNNGELRLSRAFGGEHVGTSNYLLGWQFLPKWGR